MANSLLRLPSVLNATGYSRSSLYLLIQKKLWPKQVNLGARAVAWPASEVDALVSARIAGKSEGEIKALVAQLEAQRGGRA